MSAATVAPVHLHASPVVAVPIPWIDMISIKTHWFHREPPHLVPPTATIRLPRVASRTLVLLRPVPSFFFSTSKTTQIAPSPLETRLPRPDRSIGGHLATEDPQFSLSRRVYAIVGSQYALRSASPLSSRSWIIALETYQQVLAYRGECNTPVTYSEVLLGVSVILTTERCDLGNSPLRTHTRQITGSTEEVLPYTPVDLRKPFEYKGRNSVRDPLLVQIVPRRLLPTGIDLVVPNDVFFLHLDNLLLGEIPLLDPAGQPYHTPFGIIAHFDLDHKYPTTPQPRVNEWEYHQRCFTHFNTFLTASRAVTLPVPAVVGLSLRIDLSPMMGWWPSDRPGV
ncbi:hypothetical protein HDU93_009515 [Gonapodya sp. JEL0774]|nr:hypothetical protein HDU93_009515 [Gonapodya sp. JEL0774]